jgi:long-subunit acyl-CoA synthetase (AMP-forming)
VVLPAVLPLPALILSMFSCCRSDMDLLRLYVLISAAAVWTPVAGVIRQTVRVRGARWVKLFRVFADAPWMGALMTHTVKRRHFC